MWIKQINLDTAHKGVLRTLSEALKKKNIQHPICQQLDEKIGKVRHFILEGSRKQQHCLPNIKTGETSYIQPYGITPDETINALRPVSGKLESIEIGFPNDKLIAFISDNFPNLKSLVIKEKLNWWYWNTWEDFTDKGLESFAKLQHLKRFDLMNASLLYSVTRKAFEKLLSTPHFTANLEELNLEFLGVSDTCLPIIASYQQLKHLYISVNMIGGDLTALLKSPSLQKSLSYFSFYNQSFLDDNSFKQLQKFSSLQHFSIQGEYPGYTDLSSRWKVSEPVFLQFLESQKKLISLTLQDPSINDAIADKLHQMSGLTHLSLADCSKVYTDDWKRVLADKTNLTSLDIGKIASIDLSLMSSLPLKFLSLEFKEYSLLFGYEEFCRSKSIQDTLTTLHLSGMQFMGSGGFQPLVQLTNLTALRLDKCPHFNNDALESILPLSDSLETLELGLVPLDDRSLKMFSQLKKLRNLYLATWGWTQEGREALLQDEFLKKNIQCIETKNFPYNDEQAFQFMQFKNIQVLILDSAIKMSDEGETSLKDWAWKNKIRVFFPGTAGVFYGDFEHGVKAVETQ